MFMIKKWQSTTLMAGFVSQFMAYFHEKSAFPVFLCLWSIKLLSNILLEQNGNILIGTAELYLDIYGLPYFPLSFL